MSVSCFERLGGYLTIPFKHALKNLPLFRGQSVKDASTDAHGQGIVGLSESYKDNVFINESSSSTEFLF
jgi:hypothetical protein